jgi:hypothetical protein
MVRSRGIQAVVVMGLLATPLFLFGDRALAVQDSEDKVLFGPIGVGVGQGMRVNVYSIVTIGTGGTVPFPTAPWEFTVRIFDARGVLVQERKFEAAPGVTRSLEVTIHDPEDFPADRLGRRTLRAEIVGFNPQPDPPGKYTATLEVYSRLTGHTSIFVGNPDTLPAAHQ